MKKSVILILILTLFASFGCNKTGVKGTVIYGPTNTPIEDIEISVVPNDLNTEERESFIKTGRSDKNGEFKIKGLDHKYSYRIFLDNDQYCLNNPKDHFLNFSLVEDQTKILSQPVIIKDVLPGTGSFVKRSDNSFEPLTEFGSLSEMSINFSNPELFSEMNINYSSFILLPDKHLCQNPIIYFTNETTIINSNPTKIKNGEIIYFMKGSPMSSVSNWIFPLDKYTSNSDCESIVKTFNIPDVYIASGLHFELTKAFNDTYIGIRRTELGIQHYNIKSLYYKVNLNKGYYILSTAQYSFTHGLRDRRYSETFIFEVVDDMNTVYDGDVDEEIEEDQ